MAGYGGVVGLTDRTKLLTARVAASQQGEGAGGEGTGPDKGDLRLLLGLQAVLRSLAGVTLSTVSRPSQT